MEPQTIKDEPVNIGDHSFKLSGEYYTDPQPNIGEVLAAAIVAAASRRAEPDDGHRHDFEIQIKLGGVNCQETWDLVEWARMSIETAINRPTDGSVEWMCEMDGKPAFKIIDPTNKENSNAEAQ